MIIVLHIFFPPFSKEDHEKKTLKTEAILHTSLPIKMKGLFCCDFGDDFNFYSLYVTANNGEISIMARAP